jgi:hypothetical protein
MTKVLTMEKAAGRPVGREYAPEVKVVNFTPALAEAILNNNRLNRPLREGRVEKYARDMAAGRWRMNAETIKLTREGDLLDGQHRMFAVIEAVNLMPKGKSLPPIPMMVVEGLDAEVMPTIDTGAARTFADVLTIPERPSGVAGSAPADALGAAYASREEPGRDGAGERGDGEAVREGDGDAERADVRVHGGVPVGPGEGWRLARAARHGGEPRHGVGGEEPSGASAREADDRRPGRAGEATNDGQAR